MVSLSVNTVQVLSTEQIYPTPAANVKLSQLEGTRHFALRSQGPSGVRAFGSPCRSRTAWPPQEAHTALTQGEASSASLWLISAALFW